MVKNQRNSCCHMGCPPMFVHLHFHRGYSLGPQKSKPLIIYGIVRYRREAEGITHGLSATCNFRQAVEQVLRMLAYRFEIVLRVECLGCIAPGMLRRDANRG